MSFTGGTQQFFPFAPGVPNSVSGGISTITGTAPINVTPGQNPVVSLTTPLAVIYGGTGTTTPNLFAGSNITLSGVWPNITISATVGGAGVASVVGGSNILSSGGSNPVISTVTNPSFASIAVSGGVVAGTLSATASATVATGLTVGATLGVTGLATAGTFNSPRFESLNGNGILGLYNVKDFGAVGDGVTDDSAAFIAALTAAGNANPGFFFGGGGTVWVPDAYYYLSVGITVPRGVTLRGASIVSNNGASTTGAHLFFNATTPICVTVGPVGGWASLTNIYVDRQGSTPFGVGVYSLQTSGVYIANVYSRNHTQCYSFVQGIVARMENCYSSHCNTYHIFVDGWAELYVNDSRFGANGTDDLSSTAYVYVAGTSNAAPGPNTLYFNMCHFNQGSGLSALHWVEFDSILASGGYQGEIVFSSCHAEAINGSAIFSTSSVPFIYRMKMVSCTTLLGVPFMALDPATGIGQFEITSCLLGCSTFNVTVGVNIGSFSLTGGEITGTASIAGSSTAGSVNIGAIANTVFDGGLTVSGVWSELLVVTPSPITFSGTPFNSTSSLTIIAANLIAANQPMRSSGGATLAAAMMPPAYANTGASAAATFHTVEGFVTAGGASTTITLSGSAVFANSITRWIVQDSSTGGFAVVTSVSNTSVTFSSTTGHNYGYSLAGF